MTKLLAPPRGGVIAFGAVLIFWNSPCTGVVMLVLLGLAYWIAWRSLDR